MRDISLTRTQGEALVDLLEDCDPLVVGTWRHDIAADIRQAFGMVPLYRQTELIKILADEVARLKRDYALALEHINRQSAELDKLRVHLGKGM